MKHSGKILYIFTLSFMLAMLILMCIDSQVPLKKINTSVDLSKPIINEISYVEFKKMIKDQEIEIVYLNDTASDEKVYLKAVDQQFYYTDNPNYNEFKKDLLEQGININPSTEIQNILTQQNNTDSEPQKTSIYSIIIFSLIIIVIILCMQKPKEINKIEVTSLGKAKIYDTKSDDENKIDKKEKNKKTFDDIAGLSEVKKDMWCLVDFIKNNEIYINAGAKLPKGVILYGPPGTGKTLLAKAIATEANVPFFYMSGSDFVEMYVGVGAKRVRELFANAKKNAPCIIFIDELDTIGGKRDFERNSEDRKTINALLTEMDGFNNINNILVIGATNRIEDLDPALTRPGRFTNKYCVPLPQTPSERLEIIKLYAKDKNFYEDFDFEQVAKETIGCSPAQIESLLNEAAIISVQEKKTAIDKEIFDKAMMKSLLYGHIKTNQRERDENELKLVAWHEAGHALIGKLFNKDVNKVTILSTTSGAGGVTFTTPSKLGLLSAEELKMEVQQLYGGRAAEYLLYNNYDKVTTGATNDIEKATNIIHNIISVYGMSPEYGLINLSKITNENKDILNAEIALSKELEKITINLLKANKDKLEKIANLLLEKETIYADDLEQIMNM